MNGGNNRYIYIYIYCILANIFDVYVHNQLIIISLHIIVYNTYCTVQCTVYITTVQYTWQGLVLYNVRNEIKCTHQLTILSELVQDFRIFAQLHELIRVQQSQDSPIHFISFRTMQEVGIIKILGHLSTSARHGAWQQSEEQMVLHDKVQTLEVNHLVTLSLFNAVLRSLFLEGSYSGFFQIPELKSAKAPAIESCIQFRALYIQKKETQNMCPFSIVSNIYGETDLAAIFFCQKNGL